MHIYASLLKQMAPEHLLATSAKLCAEILAAVCDGLLSVDDAGGRAVLQVGITWFPANMKYLIIFLKKKIKYLDAIFDMMRTAYSMLGTWLACNMHMHPEF